MFGVKFSAAVFVIVFVQCNGQDGNLEINEENFKDLQCSLRGEQGLCWPSADCKKPLEGGESSCDIEGLTSAVCCPIDDQATNPDPVDRSIISGPPTIRRFINTHQPKSSYWTWYRMRTQNSSPPPLWRPTLPPPRTIAPPVLEPAFPPQQQPSLPPVIPSESLIPRNECAKVVSSLISPLIVNGVEATVDEFPFIGAFMTREFNEVFCGGALISPSWVLTASHCVERRTTGEFYIRFRDTNLADRTDGTPVDIAPEKFIVHPEYKRIRVYNDIALVKLSRPATDPGIKSVCLPQFADRSIDGSSVTVIGYGSESAQGESIKKLMKVVIKALPADDCKEAYAGSNRLPQGIVPTLICAGDVAKGKDACRGDSGGPLLLNEQGTWSLVGVVAAGRDCGVYNGLYTRVSSYYEWILATTKE